MAADLAPEWPIGDRDGTYHIVIDGDPDIDVQHDHRRSVGIDCGRHGGDRHARGQRSAVRRRRPPGLLNSLDLPLTLPRHAFD